VIYREKPRLVEKLRLCATCAYEDTSPYKGRNEHDLYLDYRLDDATRAGFRYHFGEGAEGSEDEVAAKSALNLSFMHYRYCSR